MTEPIRPTESVEPPVPYLRREANPSATNGRRVLLAVLAFFLLLLGFVIVLVVTIGQHNDGVKIPPGPAPHATQPS